MPIQTPALILPTNYAAGTGTLASTETVADLVEHTSVEFNVADIAEKTIHITATEIALAAVAAGNLWCWVELSPYPSVNNPEWLWPLPASTAYWAAIGGGGGALPPTAPIIEVSGLAGAPGALIHGITFSWNTAQPWVRVVIQTPVAANLPLAYWVCQVIVSGNSN